MALDADTVIWALRGLHDPQDGGVRAHDVARFISMDATVSEDYSRDDVTVVLESLVAEGMLTHASTSTEELDEDAPSDDTTLYRFPSDPELFAFDDRSGADVAEHNGWDHWLGPGADQSRDFLLAALGDDAGVGVADNPPSAAVAAETAAFLRIQVDELERERDALLAERDTWRQHAESADEEVARARSEGDELKRERDAFLAERDVFLAERDTWQQRAESAEAEVSRLRGEGDELHIRVRDLESLLARERALAAERLEATRRAAAGFALALEDLERLDPSLADSRARAQATQPKKTRGNWLE